MRRARQTKNTGVIVAFMPAQFVESLLSLAFPVVCEICGESAPVCPPTGVCESCESGIQWIPGPHCVSCGRTLKAEMKACAECSGKVFYFDRAFACARYQDGIKELLHAYKFNGQKHLKRFFIETMRQFIITHLKEFTFDAVVAVPLDTVQERKRGFNQSSLLSAGLSAFLRVPDLSRFLRRKYSHEPQHRMGKFERERNVRDCFHVSDAEKFVSKNILLIDDILTTGQTVSECARALKQSGAREVTALACARGI